MKMSNEFSPMRAAILEAAGRMTQHVGYTGLSFRDLASAVGIKSASVHYHFPTKGDLGAAVARRYTDQLVERMQAADEAGADPFETYVDCFRSALAQDGRMCLCGMLAAEADAVPAKVQAEVRRFIDINVAWLTAALARVTGQPEDSLEMRQRGAAVFAAMEGAMLIARGTGDLAVFDTIVGAFRQSGLLPE